MLFVSGKATEQRQNLEPPFFHPVECVSGVTNLAFAAKEHQHVTGWFVSQLGKCANDALDLVECLGGGVRVGAVGGQTAVPDVHWVGAAADEDDRCWLAIGVGKMAGETVGVDGRRGDDHAQVGPGARQLTGKPQQHVDGQAAFVSLIDDDGVIFRQCGIPLDCRQQHSIGHHFHLGIGR